MYGNLSVLVEATQALLQLLPHRPTTPAIMLQQALPLTQRLLILMVQSAKVDFYNGSTLLGTDTSSPYAFTWTNVAAGSYTLTARATDNGNATGTSSVVNVTVNNVSNPLPTTSITSPANGATFTAPASITINANASDNGSVTKVDFYNGSAPCLERIPQARIHFHGQTLRLDRTR